MIIAFSLIPYQRYSGAGEYYHGLIAKLQELAPQNTYKIIVPKNETPVDYNQLNQKDCIEINIPSAPGWLRYIKTIARNDIQNTIGKIDILHSFNYPVIRCNAKNILTVYDMRHEDALFSDRLIARTVLKKYRSYYLQRIDRIITISDFTKERLLANYPVTGDKIETIHLGIDPKKTIAVLNALPAVNIRPRPYILYVAHIHPHKNHFTLLDAFKTLTQNNEFQHDLILVGHDYSQTNSLKDRILERGLAGRVIVTGRVSDADKLRYYQQASLFVLPSLYEGFGLPVLEAMACDIPVLVSDSTVFPEIVTNKEQRFDPTNSNSIATAIQSMLNNAPARQTAIEDGRKTVQQMTVDTMARKTLEVYNKVCSNDSFHGPSPVSGRGVGGEGQ